jgi:hypothetical protein
MIRMPDRVYPTTIIRPRVSEHLLVKWTNNGGTNGAIFGETSALPRSGESRP